MHKFLIWANPYVHVDARGWLAGGLPIPAPVGTSRAAPSFVGAVREMVPGTYDKGAEVPGTGRLSRDVGMAQHPRQQTAFSSFADAAVEVTVDHEGAMFLRQRDAAGDVFVVSAADDVPLERLARARMRAVAKFKAERGADAKVPVEKWAEQFPLDEVVASLATDLEADDKAEVEAVAPESAPEPARTNGEAALKAAREAIAARKAEAAKAKADAAPAPALRAAPKPAPKPAPAPPKTTTGDSER